jgi:hypothetical protein
LENRVHYIQEAEEWLAGLSGTPISLPNIKEIYVYELDVAHPFFDSLRAGYGEVRFNQWFANAAQQGRKAWIYTGASANPEALCIYDVQTNQTITDGGQVLSGRALKLCTFKVSEAVRGRKIGELF